MQGGTASQPADSQPTASRVVVGPAPASTLLGSVLSLLSPSRLQPPVRPFAVSSLDELQANDADMGDSDAAERRSMQDLNAALLVLAAAQHSLPLQELFLPYPRQEDTSAEGAEGCSAPSFTELLSTSILPKLPCLERLGLTGMRAARITQAEQCAILEGLLVGGTFGSCKLSGFEVVSACRCMCVPVPCCICCACCMFVCVCVPGA